MIDKPIRHYTLQFEQNYTRKKKERSGERKVSETEVAKPLFHTVGSPSVLIYISLPLQGKESRPRKSDLVITLACSLHHGHIGLSTLR